MSVSVSIWSTPYIVVSSSAVMKPSIGPCGIVSSSITAIIAATAIPSSAPSVVPFVLTHSPSIQVSIGSFKKSCLESLAFCGTISIWPCIVTTLRSSIPGVAGLRIMILPALSWKASILRSFAQSRRNFWIFSKWPEGRGTCVRR